MSDLGPLRLAEVLDAAQVVKVPLAIPFRGVVEREAVLLEGPAGWGEFAPFPEYPPSEASWWLDSALEAAFVGWPRARRTQVGVNAIIPAVDAEHARSLALQASTTGYRTVKVKVAAPGTALDSDRERLLAIRSVFPGAVRLDANGAWSVAEALVAIPALEAAAERLEYVEQPCPDLTELAEVRRATGVAIAADESIRRAHDPVLAAQAQAVDIVVVKVAPLGGVRRALRVVAAAATPVVVSSALDTSVGLAAGIALAAALPELSHDCGLATAALLADDVVRNPAIPSGGSLPADYRPDVDPLALARGRARVDRATTAMWRDRIVSAWNAGSAERFETMLADSQT